MDLIAKSFTSKSNIRPALQHIKLEQTATHRIATATDTYRAIRISTESTDKTIKTILLNKVRQTIKLKKGEITFASQESSSPDPDAYPETEQIFDKALEVKDTKDSITIKISPQFLLEAAKAMKQGKGPAFDEYIEMTINTKNPDESILFTMDNTKAKAKMEILIMVTFKIIIRQ